MVAAGKLVSLPQLHSTMNRLYRFLLVCCATIAIPHGVASAQPGDYLLNSADPNNAVTVNLLAGSWSIGVSSGAWSPWNYVSECDGVGANCHTGFHTAFYYSVNGGPSTKWGWDGSEREVFFPMHISDFYASPELAFEQVFTPLVLEVAAPATLRLYIPDCCFWDNVGALTVSVAPTVTPEPDSVALMAAGLSVLGFVAFRRRRTMTIGR